MTRGQERTPIGLELSVKAHVLEVQIHFPWIGSQNGVEQFAGTEKKTATRSDTARDHKLRMKRTAETRLLAIRDLLGGVRVVNSRSLLRTAVLFGKTCVSTCEFRTIAESLTYACKEGEVGEVAVAQEAILVLGNTVTDLQRGVHLGRGALERIQRVELRRRHGVPYPVEQLAG